MYQVPLAGSGQPPLDFVDISTERIDNITVGNLDETLKHGTEGYENRSYKVDYFKFLGIAPDMGPIGNLVRLHKRIEKEYKKNSGFFTLRKIFKFTV
jgi:hypothetical protein